MAAETGPRVVVIGAGIVGCALADELTARGVRDVTVLDRGPLFAGPGSSYHAPGLVFATSPARVLSMFARYTIDKYRSLGCFASVGGLEVATTEERAADLYRRAGLAASWGVAAEPVTARRCAELWPPLDRALLLGGLHTPDDGLADAALACRKQAESALRRGAAFHGHHTVTAVERGPGGVTGVVTDRGSFAADVVVSAAGFWGPVIGAMAGVTVPLQPLAHQYARTAPLPGLDRTARLPILRHQDRDLYVRQHGDRLGIGSYAHRPMPVDPFDLTASELPFSADEFAPSWRDAALLVPALADSAVEHGFDGVFSFTPDGMPLIGEVADVPGLWLAEAVWVTHSAGVARAVAEWLVDGRPSTDVHACDVNRFHDVQLSPRYIAERGARNFVEVYDVIHPLQPMERPRPLRTSPFHPRHLELGAYHLESGGWERPHWFEANAPLADALPPGAAPARDPWAARHWSPIVAAEALATRERVGLFDMTPLTRLDVRGPGALAFLRRLTTGRVDRRVGAVVYALLLDHAGGIRSDITAARLGDDHWQIGCNGPLDLDWLRRHLPEDGSVAVTDITAGTCCVGVWGPEAVALVQPLADIDVSHAAFRYFTARRVHIGHVPVTALRVSYVGESGWELYTTADLGLRLWDTLWEAGRRLGAVAAGRGAFESLRLEKGYRAWGTDMTAEHDPYEAGLGFAVRREEGNGEGFIGGRALSRKRRALSHPSGATAERRLACLTLDDPTAIVLGDEPVYAGDGAREGGSPVGYVTSAGYGHTVGRAIAYAWLPADLAVPGTGVHIAYFGEKVPATVRAEPLLDPEMARIRR
ncbi:GcvT family protein [Streptomyces radicis]|uniref:FAD-dependent oxidoreductase n=1 Tax=Streptomyces radicis TaxID=1750517 RepID=A0A3A9WHD7_9ACTN|nr:FAD-dependent oxidoreductase [Streptomyces radicis]RKN12012.1 FAD-dependent oxidoreductase [Streptomyces radicis]RKN25937.1 FAD-dependent oxidoreductase [Streptomyces radicis]